MNPSSKLLAVCLLLAVPFTPTLSQGDEEEDAVRCVRVRQIDRTEVIDGRTIAFHMRGGDIYLNTLRRECRGLDRGRPFSYRTSTGQICSVDSITILEDYGFGLTAGETCGLSMFTPTDEDVLDILKGDAEPAEIDVEEIEIEVTDIELEQDE